jgi:hypothetical protein
MTRHTLWRWLAIAAWLAGAGWVLLLIAATLWALFGGAKPRPGDHPWR